MMYPVSLQTKLQQNLKLKLLKSKIHQLLQWIQLLLKFYLIPILFRRFLKQEIMMKALSLQRWKAADCFLVLFLSFLPGLALNLTPCVYPLIPITIGYFGGQAEGKTSRLVMLGLIVHARHGFNIFGCWCSNFT